MPKAFSRYINVACASLLAATSASGADGRLPGVVRQNGNVYLIENHSTAYSVWHDRGVRGATLVHLDTHDDCRYVPPEKLKRLHALTERREFDAVFRLSDMGFVNRFETAPDTFLFDLGNFIYPCIADGTVTTFYWVVPDRSPTELQKRRLRTHLARVLRIGLEDFSEDEGGGWFRASLLGAEVIVTQLDRLPRVEPGALLDFDIDFFAFPHGMTDRHLTGRLAWDPATTCRLVADKVPDPQAVTVCSSVWGGYLPVMLRFIPDACFEFFARGAYPSYADELLDVVTHLRVRFEAAPLPAPPSDNAFAPAYNHLAGLMRLMHGDTAAAIAKLTEAARGRHVYRKGLADAAEALTRMNNPSGAHRVLDALDALEGKPTASAIAARARVHVAEGNLKAADRLSLTLTEWDPRPHHLLLRGGVLTEQQRYAEAAEAYEQVLQQSPNRAIGHYNMGVVLDRRGRQKEAVAYYRIATMLDPGFAAAHENLGKNLLDLGDTAGAIPHLEQAVRLGPPRVETLNNLAIALSAGDRRIEAIAVLERALGLDANVADTHLNMGTVLAGVGRLQDALRHVVQALALRPGWETAERSREALVQAIEARD